MIKALQSNVFLVKEHLGLFKAANNYDIHDPETGAVIMHCREDYLGIFTKILRVTEYKKHTPFDIRVSTPDGQQVVRVTRGAVFIRSNVHVLDEHDQPIGAFHQKVLSIGGAFTIVDNDGREMCKLTGKWTSWDFSFTAGDTELAHVSKKWGGIGKELLTSADNYILEVSDSVPSDSRVRQLILAAVMCIDMVLKE